MNMNDNTHPPANWIASICSSGTCHFPYEERPKLTAFKKIKDIFKLSKHKEEIELLKQRVKYLEGSLSSINTKNSQLTKDCEKLKFELKTPPKYKAGDKVQVSKMSAVVTSAEAIESFDFINCKYAYSWKYKVVIIKSGRETTI